MSQISIPTTPDQQPWKHNLCHVLSPWTNKEFDLACGYGMLWPENIKKSASRNLFKRQIHETLINIFKQENLYLTEEHVQTPRYDQYLTQAHNHITLVVAAMDSCFVLFRTRIDMAQRQTRGLTCDHRPAGYYRGEYKSTPLSASSTADK